MTIRVTIILMGPRSVSMMSVAVQAQVELEAYMKQTVRRSTEHTATMR